MCKYKHLITIAQQPSLIQYSPNKIDTHEDLKDYMQHTVDIYYQKTAIPFITFDKLTNSFASLMRFALIN